MADLFRLSASEAAARIREGKLTSEALVRSCFERIHARESQVKAWVHLDRDFALAQARECDRSASRGPIHGVPFAAKDIMDTADLPTEYGSPIYKGNRPAADAACVALSRAAGGVLLGKTVTTEFASRFPLGNTTNPHNPQHTPGGSSSGSAAAVGDFMVPLAFGTQTVGSVIRPAAFCGCIGYKPSYGEVSTQGVKQNTASFDTVGLFARAVEDLALFRAAVTGFAAKPLAAIPINELKIGFCRTCSGTVRRSTRKLFSKRPQARWRRPERKSPISISESRLNSSRPWAGASMITSSLVALPGNGIIIGIF